MFQQQEQNCCLKKKVNEFNDALNEAQRSIEKLEDCLNSAKKEVDCRINENNGLKDEINRLKCRIDELMAKQ